MSFGAIQSVEDDTGSARRDVALYVAPARNCWGSYRTSIVFVDPTLNDAAVGKRHWATFANEQAGAGRSRIISFISVQLIQDIRFFRQAKHCAKNSLVR